jgi:hypothetical protein
MSVWSRWALWGVVIMMVFCPLAAHAKDRTARDLFTPAQVERMTGEQFTDLCMKRGALETEHSVTVAAYYYLDVKSALHKRQAARVSRALPRKIDQIRLHIDLADWAAFDHSWPTAPGMMYVNMFRAQSMDREDAIGRILRALIKHPHDRQSTRQLLRRIAALDMRIHDKKRPFHKLARQLAGLPYPALKIVLQYERKTADWIVDMQKDISE